MALILETYLSQNIAMGVIGLSRIGVGLEIRILESEYRDFGDLKCKYSYFLEYISKWSDSCFYRSLTVLSLCGQNLVAFVHRLIMFCFFLSL